MAAAHREKISLVSKPTPSGIMKCFVVGGTPKVLKNIPFLQCQQLKKKASVKRPYKTHLNFIEPIQTRRDSIVNRHAEKTTYIDASTIQKKLPSGGNLGTIRILSLHIGWQTPAGWPHSHSARAFRASVMGWIFCLEKRMLGKGMSFFFFFFAGGKA